MSLTTWKFNIIDKWDKIWSEEHLSLWQHHLEQAAPNAHIFFFPEVVRAWVNTYLPLRRMSPVFIWANDDQGTTAFMPLIKWRRNWKNAFLISIIPVGYSDFDYHNPIFNQVPANVDSFWKELTEFLAKSFHYDNLIIDGITNDFITNSNLWKKNEICPYLSLSQIKNEEDLYKFLPTKLRGDIRRQIRRLNEQGELSYKTYNSYEEALTTFEDFMATHRQKWPNAYKAPHFHENLLKEGLPSGFVHFSSLNINQCPIAWHLGFQGTGRYYYYMPAGHPNFAKNSPVKVHLFYLINKAVENRFEVFDHLRGDENYKTGWSNGHQYVYSLSNYDKGITTYGKRLLLQARKLLNA